MNSRNDILQLIKSSVHAKEPNATIVLYGSYARADHRENSDIDILILIDKDKITPADAKRVAYPLYDIEFDTGKIISPLILSRKSWETKHRITPFYKMWRKRELCYNKKRKKRLNHLQWQCKSSFPSANLLFKQIESILNHNFDI